MSAKVDKGMFSNATVYFYVFECKDCGNVWFSLFHCCSKCDSKRYRILDHTQVQDYFINKNTENEIWKQLYVEASQDAEVAEDLEKL